MTDTAAYINKIAQGFQNNRYFKRHQYYKAIKNKKNEETFHNLRKKMNYNPEFYVRINDQSKDRKNTHSFCNNHTHIFTLGKLLEAVPLQNIQESQERVRYRM